MLTTQSVGGSTSTPRVIPFQELLGRLQDSLNAIDSKTKPFQVSGLMEEKNLKDSVQRSEFEAELTGIVKFAEEINSKLPF